MVSIVTAARMLGVRPWPVLELCRTGVLPSVLIGEQRVIPRASVVEYVARVARGGVR
ncbi:MAG TPA: helix-turn-helix domain-containing protein [Nocardioidaceae bacterium]|jgi:hypothetical protein